MVTKLLLTLTLSASCMFCGGSEDRSLQVKCRSSMYPIKIKCSWTPPQAPNATTPTEYIATYRFGQEDSAETKTCFQRTPTTRCCTMYDFILLSREPHVLNVTAIHPGGITTTLFPFVPEEIIKPDRPVVVGVSIIPGNQLRVQWDRPPTWPMPNVFRLKYLMRYRPCKSKYAWKVGPTVNTTYTIKSVQPHAVYCIQVKAQDFYGYGKWSCWSFPVTFSLTPGN